jgi:hypothetical protein
VLAGNHEREVRCIGLAGFGSRDWDCLLVLDSCFAEMAANVLAFGCNN